MSKTKVCVRCKMILPIDEFCRRSLSKDQYQSYCKRCMVEANRERYELRKRQKKDRDKDREPLAFVHPDSLIVLGERNTEKYKKKNDTKIPKGDFTEHTSDRGVKWTRIQQ